MDDYAFLLEQAEALEYGQFDRLAINRLAEEIRMQAKREYRSAQSSVIRIIEHLIKLKYIDKNTSTFINNRAGWEISVMKQRRDLQRTFKESPKLRADLYKEWEETGFREEIDGIVEMLLIEYVGRLDEKAIVPFSWDEIIFVPVEQFAKQGI